LGTICRDIEQTARAEKALHHNETRYRSIVEDQTELICRFLPNGTSTFVNSAYCRYFDKKTTELVGHNLIPLLPAEDQEKLKKHLRALNRANPVATVEHQVLRPNGSIGWQRWTYRAIYDENGKLLEFQAVGRDITDRKLAELALMESETRYRLLAENISDVIWVVGPDLSLQYISPAISQMAGYSVAEALLLGLKHILTPESWIRARHVFQELTEEGFVFEGPHPRKKIELEMIRKDGTILWTETTMSILWGHDGIAKGLLGVIRDISERKLYEQQLKDTRNNLERRVQERTAVLTELNEQLKKQIENRIWAARALRQSEETAQALLNATSEAAFLLDENFQVLAANKTANKSLGISIKDFMYDCLPQLLTLERARARLQIFKRVLSANEPTSFKETIKDRLFFTKVFPVLGRQNGPRRIAVFSQDITDREKTLEKIKEGEARQKAILNNIPDIAWLKDKDSRYIAVNEAFAETFGKRPEDIVGKNDLDLWPSKKAGKYLREDLQVLHSGKRLRVEDTVISLIKGFTVYEAIITPLFNSQGDIVGTAGISRDITERKKAEEALKHEKERFKLLVEQSPIGISLIDQVGIYEYVNPAFVEMFGYDLKDFHNGREWFRMVFPEKGYRKRAIAEWLDHSSKVRTEQSEPQTYSVTCADQSIKQIEFRSVNLPTGGHLVLYEDITNRLLAEETIKESEARLRRVFEASPDPMIVYSVDGAVTYLNPAFTKTFGWTLTELLGRQIPFVPEEVKKQTQEVIEKLYGGGKLPPWETKRLTKDGRVLDMQISCALFYDWEGEKAGSIIILRDITDRKRVEQKLLDYQVQLRELASALTLTEERERRRLAVDLHDGLAQHLALISIKLESELGSSTRPRKKPLQEILGLVDQTLQQARSITVELSPPILHELGLVAALHWLAAKTSQSHGVATHVEAKMPPQPLQVDLAVWLFRAARELVLNSIKHAKPSKINIMLSGEGSGIKLCVEDDGRGFDTSSLEKVFSKSFGFFSLRERVRSWGGELLIESEPEKGTLVTIMTALESKR